MSQKSVDNHYIPKMYLKNWSEDGSTVWMYRRLVSNKNVQWWKKQSINNTAYLPNLYGHVKQGNTTDEFENWLNHVVETPAKPALEKAVAGTKLSDKEMLALLRFTAAQLVRTPAYFIKIRERWINDFPQQMAKTMDEVCAKAARSIERGKKAPPPKPFTDNLFPLRLTPTEEDGKTYLKAETVVGRAMWLSHIQRMVDVHINVLRKHQWHIIEAAPSVEWPTSDDPVICLGYKSDNDYNFDGRIAQKNVDILFPLSPKHLLYTQVGNRSSTDHMQKNERFSELARRFILEHGFLHIYSKNRQKGMFQYCPRTINASEHDRIQKMLLDWHNNNAGIEAEYF